MFFKSLSQIKDERKVIIIFLIIIALIIGVIKLFNKTLKNNSSSSINTTTAINANVEKNIINMIDNDSIDFFKDNNNGSENIENLKTPEDVINTFVYYCNKGQFTNAYNMLSDECKVLYFKNENEFYKNYYMKIFNNIQKDVSYEKNKYNSNIFKVTYFDDALTTGKVNSDNNYTDTVTVLNINGSYKINVLNFVQKQDVNVSNSNDYIEVTMVDKTIYTDNEIYKIKVKNKTSVEMVLSEMISKSDIYLLDQDGNKFYFDNDEYIKEDVTISPNAEVTLDIKINRNYNNKRGRKLGFSNIKLINKFYYDSNKPIKNELTGDVTYQQMYTEYTPEFSFEINF